MSNVKDFIQIKSVLLQSGTFAKENNLRLTAHPGPFNVLVSPNENVVKNTINDLSLHGEMFDLLIREPNLLPDSDHLMSKDARDQARHICDYIAGMTDKFAIEEHHRLFDITDSLA